MKAFNIFSKIILGLLLLSACSSNEELMQKQNTKIDDLQFNVVVERTSVNSETRVADKKSAWKEGDIIYVAIDGDDNNLCKLTYTGTEHWTVSSLTDNASFTKDKGKLSAIYASSLDRKDNVVTTLGDVLYTEEGSYAKVDNVVSIHLTMNKRPLSRIVVKGIDKNFKIDNATCFSTLKAFSPISWEKSNEVAAYEYDETDRSAVYYGLIPTSEGKSVVRLVDEITGVTYTRTYNKTQNADESIVINGPLSSESAQWEKYVILKRLSLNKTNIKLTSGDTESLSVTAYPSNATDKSVVWITSDANVAKVSVDGKVTAVNNGYATITARNLRSGLTASCEVNVADITDFISFKESSYSQSIIGYTVSMKRAFVVSNTSSHELNIKSSYLKPLDNSFMSHLKSWNIQFSSQTLPAYGSIQMVLSLTENASGTYSNGYGSSSFSYGFDFYYNGILYSKDKDSGFMFKYN